MGKLKNILTQANTVFLLFFILLMIQLSFVYLYHDDFGYASLSYVAYVDGVSGTNFGIKDFFEFLYKHYIQWGGIFYGGIEILLLKIDVNAFRVFQALCTVIIFYFIFLIATKNTNNKKYGLIAFATVSTYGLYSLNIASGGLYWFIASVNYLVPMVFMFGFVYVYFYRENIKYRSKISKWLIYVIFSLAVFLSSVVPPHMSGVSVFMLLSITIYNWYKNKRIRKSDIILSLIALCGLLYVLLSPGNAVRMVSSQENIHFYLELSLIQKIKFNLPNIIRGNFNSDNLLFTFVFFVTAFYISFDNLRFNNGIRIINILSLLSILMIVILNSTQVNGYFEWLHDNLSIYNTIFVIQFCLVFYSIFLYLFNKREFLILMLFTGGILSQIAMIAAPDFSYRSTIIFETISFILTINVLSAALSKLQNLSDVRYVIYPYCFVAIFNFIGIMGGYYKNASVNKENNKMMTENAKRIKAGEKINIITLKKLPDLKYSDYQPYMKGCDYIYFFMKEYYDIPKDVRIIYND